MMERLLRYSLEHDRVIRLMLLHEGQLAQVNARVTAYDEVPHHPLAPSSDGGKGGPAGGGLPQRRRRAGVTGREGGASHGAGCTGAGHRR